MRPSGSSTPEEDEKRRLGVFGLSLSEGTNFSLSHRHSGLHGDGQRVQAASLDTVNPFTVGSEPTYIPANALTSGRQYRIQIVEVTDPDTQQISPVLQVVPV